MSDVIDSISEIEQLKQKISELEEKNTTLEEIIENIPGNVYWRGLDGKYLGCNKSNLAMMELNDISDFVGKTEHDLVSDDKFADEFKSLADQIVESDEAVTKEETWLNTNGEEIVFLSRKVPLHDASGKVKGMLGVSFDITEQKRREIELIAAKEKAEKESKAYLEEIIWHMPGHVYWKGLDGKYQGCNKNQMEFLGFSSAEEFVGKTDYDFFSKQQADGLWAVNKSVLQMGKEFAAEEIISDGSGVSETFFTRKVPLRNSEGEINGLLGMSLNVTQLKKMEVDLRRAKEAADFANLAKTEFLMNMSHDIRTPFSSIQGCCDLLLIDESNADKRELLSHVRGSCQRLLRMLNEILEFSKFEMGRKGKGEDSLELFSLSEFVTEIRQHLTNEASKKGLDYKIKLPNRMPNQVYANRKALLRVLLNLINNAAKFTAAGELGLEILLQENSSDNQLITTFIVSDTGIGMPEDKLSEIFDQFVRLTASYEDKYEGSGLGLYIVKKLLDQLNGSVKVDSKVGKGAVFRVSVPMALSS